MKLKPFLILSFLILSGFNAISQSQINPTISSTDLKKSKVTSTPVNIEEERENLDLNNTRAPKIFRNEGTNDPTTGGMISAYVNGKIVYYKTVVTGTHSLLIVFTPKEE